MKSSADVRSIPAVRQWQAALAAYADALDEALAGVELELRRVQEWLQEQLDHWKQAVREREEEVVRAKAELAQRRFPGWDGREPDCTVQLKNLRRAEARLEHAQEQIARIRRWQVRLPKLIEEVYRGPANRLRRLLEAVVPHGLADLERRLQSLEAYAGLRPDYAPAPSTVALPASPSGPSAVPSAPPNPPPPPPEQ